MRAYDAALLRLGASGPLRVIRSDEARAFWAGAFGPDAESVPFERFAEGLVARLEEATAADGGVVDRAAAQARALAPSHIPRLSSVACDCLQQAAACPAAAGCRRGTAGAVQRLAARQVAWPGPVPECKLRSPSCAADG